MTRRVAGQGNAKRIKSTTGNNKERINDDEERNTPKKREESNTESESEHRLQNEEQTQTSQQSVCNVSNNDVSVVPKSNKINTGSVDEQNIKDITKSSDSMISDDSRETNQKQNEEEHEQHKQEQYAKQTTESTTNMSILCMDDSNVADIQEIFSKIDDIEEKQDNSTPLESYYHEEEEYTNDEIADYIYDSENEEQNEEQEEEQEQWKEENSYDSNDEINEESNGSNDDDDDNREEKEEKQLNSDEEKELQEEQQVSKKSSLLTKAKLYTSSSNDDGTWTDMGVGVVSIVYETITINEDDNNYNNEFIGAANNDDNMSTNANTTTVKAPKLAEDVTSSVTEETNKSQNNEVELEKGEQRDKKDLQKNNTESNTQQSATNMTANTNIDNNKDVMDNKRDAQSLQEASKEIQSNNVKSAKDSNISKNNDDVQSINDVSSVNINSTNEGNTTNKPLINRHIAKLVMVTLDEYHELLFSTPISLEDIYSTENDKILVWDDASIGREMACSFKSTAGCLSIYNEICTYQRVERERMRLQQTPRENKNELLSAKTNTTNVLHSSENMVEDASELTIALDIDIDIDNGSNNNALPHYLRSNAEKWSVSAANLSEIYNAATLNTKTFGIFVRDSRNYFAQLAELFTKCKHALSKFTEQQQEKQKVQETQNKDDDVNNANTTRIKQITQYMELISKITLTLLQSPYNTEPKIVAQFVEDDLIDICIDIVQYALGKVDAASGFMSFAQRRASFRNPCNLPAPLLKRIHGIYSCTFLKDLLPLSLEDGDGAAPSLLSVLLQRFRYSLIDDIVSAPYIIANSFAQVDHYVPHSVHKTNSGVATSDSNKDHKLTDNPSDTTIIDFIYIRDLVAFIHDMSKSIKAALVPLESKENLYSQLVRSGLLSFLSRVMQIALHEYAWLTHNIPESKHEEENNQEKENEKEKHEKPELEHVITQTNQVNSEENPILSSVLEESSQTHSAEEQNKINNNNSISTTGTNETITKVKEITKQEYEQQRKEKSVQVKFVGSVLQMCCDLLTHCITLRPETLGELIDEVKATSINTSPTSSSISLINRWASKRTRSDIAVTTTSTDKVALTSLCCTSNVHPLESTLLHSLIECVTTLNSSSELQAVYEAINSCCVSLLPVFSFMYDRTTPLRRREIVNFWLSGRWNLESSSAIVINKNRNRSFTVAVASTNSYGSVKTENVESISSDDNNNNKEEYNEQNKKKRMENNNNNNSNDISATNHISTMGDSNDDHTTTSVKLDSMDKYYKNNNSNNNQLSENNYNNGGVGVTRTGTNGTMETTCASFTPPLLRLFDFISFQLKQYICTFSSLPINLHKSEEEEELIHFKATQNLMARKAVERQVQYALKVINVIISSPAAAVSSVESMWYDRHEGKQDNNSVNIDHIIALLLSESLLLLAVGSVLRIHHRSACNLQSSLLSFLALLVTRSNVKITKLLGSPLTQLCSSPSSVCVLPTKKVEKEALEQLHQKNINEITNNDVKSSNSKHDDNHYDDKKKKDSLLSVLESTMLLLLHYAHRGNVISGAVQHLFSVLCDNVHHEKAAMASSSHNSSMEMRHGNSLEYKNNSYYDILHDYQPSPVHNNKQHHHRDNNDDNYYYENDNDYVDDINNNEEEDEEEQEITNKYDDKQNEYYEDDRDDDEDERDEEEATSATHENEEVIGGNINSENKNESKPLVSTLTASALLHQASSPSSERHAKKRPRSHDKYDSVGSISTQNNNNSTKNEEINNNKKKIHKLHKRPVCYQSILSSLMSKYGASLSRVAPLLHHKLREALTESPTEAQRQLDAESSSIASTLERSFAASSSSSSSSSSSGANIGSANLPREYEAVAFEFGIDPRTGKSPSPPLHSNTEPVPVDDPEQALREIQIENEDTMGSLFSDEEDDDDEKDDKGSGGKSVDAAVSNSNSNINSRTAYTNSTTGRDNDIDDICKDIGGVVENNNICKSGKSESCGDNNNSNEEEKEDELVNSNSIGVESYTEIINTTNTVLCTTNNDNANETNTETLEESNINKMQQTTPSALPSEAESAASPLEQQQEEEESYQSKDCRQEEKIEQMESGVNTLDNVITGSV